MTNPKGGTDLATRLWSRVEKMPSGCWEWQGHRDPRGYGQLLSWGRTLEGAHRAAWALHNQADPAGIVVRHRCDNPPCVNPHHLIGGTHADNMRDMTSRGRNAVFYGEDSPAAKLSDSQVRAIRAKHQVVHPARKTGCSSSELAHEFDVTPEYIAQLVRGQWRRSA